MAVPLLGNLPEMQMWAMLDVRLLSYEECLVASAGGEVHCVSICPDPETWSSEQWGP